MNYLQLAQFIMKEMPTDLMKKEVVGFIPWGPEEVGGLDGKLNKVSVQYHMKDGKSLEPVVVMEF